MTQSSTLSEEFIAGFLAEHGDDELGPVASQLLFETERVRVWEMTLEPGEASPLHHHELDYLVILLEGDRIAAIPGPGSSRGPRVANVVPGKTSFLNRGETEWAVNIGARQYREVLIELKD